VENGAVSGISVGRTVITISSKDNPAVQAQCNVSVSKELDKPQVSVVRENKNIKIHWNAVDHAAYYILSRVNSKTRIVSNNLYEGTNTSYEDKELSAGNYVYTVTAVVNPDEKDADLYSDSTSEPSESILIPEDVTGVEVLSDYQHVSMFVGGSEKIQYTVLPAAATNRNVTFKSMDENIAKVDEEGVVTGVSEGNTKVIITTEEGGFTAECTVHVDEIAVKSINRISDKSITMEKNKTYQLEIKVEPDDATNKTIVWSSNNNSVVSVDNNGLLTAKATGYAIVTATAADGKTTDFYIEVKSSVTAIRLNLTTATLYLGKTIGLTATIIPADATDKTVKWISSNDTIASVDGTGKVTGKMQGTTYVSAMSADGTVVATCTVTVTKEPVTKPAKAKLKTAKKSGNKVTLKWKKVSDAAGYVIYMKTGKGKYKKIKTITSGKTVKYVKKLQSGKSYKFKIRAYKLDDDEKVYGKYSNVKTVKI
jgi:uncharacterized protein YjdB